MADVPDRNEVARTLRRWLGPVTIEEFTRLSGGASKETWSFDAIGADGTRTGLILRRDPAGPAGRARRARPGSGGHHASRTTPACRCRRCCSASPRLPSAPPGMIMRRVEGETIARRILRDDEYAPARGVLVGQLGRFAAVLHAQTVPTFFPAARSAGGAARAAGRLRPAERGVRAGAGGAGRQPAAAARPGAAARRLPAREPDRRARGTAGGAGLGAHPRREPGRGSRLALREGVAVRRGAARRPASASREDLLAAYRAAGGADISLAELRWWEILGTLRWGVICLTQAWAHLSGAHRSVELAAIGRRVCEQEWDLLLLLDPAAADRAARSRPRLTGDARPEPAPLRPPDRQRAARGGPGVPARQRDAGHDRPACVPRQGRRQRARDRGPRAGARLSRARPAR